MGHASNAPIREGEPHQVHGDALDVMVAERPTRQRRSLLPLSLRTSLALILLVPIAVTVAFAVTSASGTWSSRREAMTARSGSLKLDALVDARTAIDEEYVPSAAIANGLARHLSVTTLDRLLGVDLESELVAARHAVDRLTVLRSSPPLAAYFSKLVSLRRAESKGTASLSAIEALFSKFIAVVDAMSLTSLGELSRQAEGSAPAQVSRSLAAYGAAYTAFTSGAQQVGLTDAILISRSTPSQTEHLIAITAELATAVAPFPHELGPRAARAWSAFKQSSQDRQFTASVQLAIQVGLRRGPPPYATNIPANAAALRAEIGYLASLTTVVAAASADLGAVTMAEEDAATTLFATKLIGAALLLALEICAGFLLAGAVDRRLARLVLAASAINNGNFDVPPLDETGPRELAVAAKAFNAMAATLRAVQDHVAALAATDIDLRVLSAPLPGRMGTALHAALDRLQGSMRADEETRDLLHDRAIHDSLTGLLNRGAAVERLEHDLARARSRGQVLVLLFIDVDDLKAINDSFGHEGGDAAIRAVADALAATTRPTDIVARFGGDEFVLAWLEAPGATGPSRMAERVRQRVSASTVEVRGCPITVTCSIGVAVSEPSDTTVDSLIHRADLGLYNAKTEGRDRVESRPPHDPLQSIANSRHAARHSVPS
jgi:diguanylate cyclase (GGDEF)-like protein